MAFLLMRDVAPADCRKTYGQMKAKGMELLSLAKDQCHRAEAVFRDPFGNWQHDRA
jgi:hypothetical protein